MVAGTVMEAITATTTVVVAVTAPKKIMELDIIMITDMVMTMAVIMIVTVIVTVMDIVMENPNAHRVVRFYRFF
jgi:hypothetical protein